MSHTGNTTYQLPNAVKSLIFEYKNSLGYTAATMIKEKYSSLV